MDNSSHPDINEQLTENFSDDSNHEANSRYSIWSKSEIQHILNSIQNQNVLVSLSCKQTGDVFLSSLVDVDQSGNLLVMDPAQNRAVNDRFVRDQKVMFEAMLDQVKIYFTAERVWHCLHKGEAGLCMKIPESIVRLQRRDYFRVHLPSAPPVVCAIPALNDSGSTEWVASIVDDISLGGIAVLLNDDELQAEHGVVFSGCRFSLPEIGEIAADLEVRNISQIPLKKGGRKIRLGCQFTSLSGEVQARLQRYIIKLECERRAKLG